MRKVRVCFVIGSIFFLSNCGSEHGSRLSAGPDAYVPILDYEPFKDANKIGEFSALDSFNDFIAKYNLKNGATESTILFSGGWNSCNPDARRTDVYKRAIRFLDMRAKMGVYYNVVATCYKKLTDKVYVFSSRSKNKLASATHNELYRFLKNTSQTTTSQTISFVGHSYGGWLAMKAATNLSNQLTINGLATLDPISVESCNILKAIRSPYQLIRAVYKGCVRAPDDVNYGLISLHVDWWDNFYQDNSRLLHSSAIDKANNHFLDYSYNRVLSPFKAHMAVDSDDRAWERFSEKL